MASYTYFPKQNQKTLLNFNESLFIKIFDVILFVFRKHLKLTKQNMEIRLR